MSDFIEAPFRLFDVFKIALVQKPALHKLQSQQSPKQTLQTAFRLFNQEVTNPTTTRKEDLGYRFLSQMITKSQTRMAFKIQFNLLMLPFNNGKIFIRTKILCYQFVAELD